MTEDMGDPFAGANEDEDEDEFGTATNEWLTLDQLDERLVIFDVLKIGTKKGADGDYEYAECNVIVLDGDPIEPFISTIPGTSMNLHVSATGVVGQLKDWHRKNPGKPFLARLDSVPSRRNKAIKVMGVRKHEITDADKAMARGPWSKYKTEVPF